MKLDRLYLLIIVFLATIQASASPSCGQNQNKNSRPNILFAIADDWSWPHAGAYNNAVVRTPTFDRLAEQGMLFDRAFVAAPSCTPSRGAVLTGQAVHRLGPGASSWSKFPAELAVYPDLLEQAGYAVGFTDKGWGPGKFKAGSRSHNPAGPRFRNFQQFLETVPAEKPFCFWFGSYHPHRPYPKGIGRSRPGRRRDSDSSVPAGRPARP